MEIAHGCEALAEIEDDNTIVYVVCMISLRIEYHLLCRAAGVDL
ncbi:MAG: hypothetical protein WC541_07510 [Dehalococcoidia bacterium]